ncbi:Lon protease [Pokkaliibacter plantistimulans]|uniref:Lon protease n=1 Tax=Pokkaliibacter plantistimulans TaxID=1635171 RepID=A0ABX5M2I5_9GAMM|nr:endopeptidase La [Pokkaliibacter plantistimulans]PXF32701.1 Lon protease [Pokkaliibacter plantistimulans]
MSEQEAISPEVISVEQSGSNLILPHQALPDKLHLLPVNNRPFFPAQIHPLMISAERWQETLDRVMRTPHQMVGLCYVGDQNPDTLRPENFSAIGCIVRVHKVNELEGQIQFIAQGIKRFRIRGWLSRKAPYLVEVEYPDPKEEDADELKAYGLAVIQAIKELLPHNPLYSEELKQYLNHFSPNEPSPLCDFAAAITTSKGNELQEILDTVPLVRRMEKVLVLLRKELEMVRLQSSIREEVNSKIQDRQREFFLKEQLKVIQRELGLEKDDRSNDLEMFRARLEKLTLSEPVSQRIESELQKLSVLETGSPEYGVTRNYLDWITSVPWGVHGKDKLDLKRARKVLDKHHDGLADVKERILEFLALGAWKGEVSGSIVLLVGPPGVGKTSIGKAIAESLDRPFYRLSLGGMRDEAEIKGHRRTYIGAMPGKLVQALKEVGKANPVIMLDEIDKLGASYQGDPASALLEVLDPEQNSEFLDHYLDVRLDLSKVLFICTANQLDSIPGPLLDRMEVIRLAGYLAEEKVAIAKRHLWPKLLERAAVDKKKVSIKDGALRELVQHYAREAGVRQLEKLLQKILRKAVRKLVEDPALKDVSISSKNLVDYVGTPYFRPEEVMYGTGIVTGLAWTAMGGATLPVEANQIHQINRGFKLTGKLGDVMKESAEIAYSYVSSHISDYAGSPEPFEKGFIHLHVPEGATPKDGPSAGVTMATALISLALNQPPKKGIAMTGELTLTGKVLPVGGIREKVIAAKRSGIFELVLPDANQRDFNELPDHVKEGITAHFAKYYSDVFKVAFEATALSGKVSRKG